MSAFIVGENTMRAVVAAICARNHRGQVIREFDGVPTGDDDAATKIGRRLYAMNLDAIRQRYPDTIKNPENMPGPCDPEGRSTAVALAAEFCAPRRRSISGNDLIKAYKSMECLAYQCSEGDVPQTQLFKELERATASVAAEIVSALPQYKAAPWD